MDLPPTFADARRRLTARPVGRTARGIRGLGQTLDQTPAGLDEITPVAGDVSVGLVLDDDVPVTNEMLRQWGVTLAQALTASFEVHGSEHPRIERIDGATLITDRSFAAFVLQTPAVARGLVSGTPLALVPTDRHLVLAVVEDLASITAAARIADHVLQGEGEPVSPGALSPEGDGWAAAGIPPGAEPSASDLARRFASLVYARQRPLLQTFYDRTRQECLVADAVLARRPDGAVQLVATVTEGVPTALPWVDAVTLVRSSGAVGVVSMAHLAAVPGLLTMLADLDPPRWYPTRFPIEFVR